MFNPIKWLWENLHGEDSPVHPDPEPMLEKLPLITMNYHLIVDGQVVPQQDDLFASEGNKPITADSKL